MATIYPISQISSLVGRTIFFDANVIIYNFWPTGKHTWEKSYSQVFKALLQQDNPRALSFNVISEVVNRILRIEYSNHLKRSGKSGALDFKPYRNSTAGQNALRDIYQIIQGDMLPLFEIVDKICTKPEIGAMLNIDHLDFNDKYIARLCQDKNMVLLTNDKDYLHSQAEILTANPAMKKKR
ncbi:MAG: PIN domain-containing protein [Bacteroidia bacterium]|nr:PIN domain-containing protein [Bacteroidia bacterium]